MGGKIKKIKKALTMMMRKVKKSENIFLRKILKRNLSINVNVYPSHIIWR